MNLETIPKRIFTCRLPGGEHELFSYLKSSPESSSQDLIEKIHWQIVPDENQPAILSGVLTVTNNDRKLGRMALAALLPSTWSGGLLNLEIQCKHSTWQESHPVLHFSQTEKYLPPLSGMILVAGAHRIGEAHRTAALIPSQHFAWDLLPLAGDGWRILSTEYTEFTRAQDFFGFGQAVLAPAVGQVIHVNDGYPDLERVNELPDPAPYLKDPRLAFGNHIILEHGSGVWSFLAHLRQGSICVGVGDRVETGQIVGKLGNSGYTSGPHLHFQFMDGSDPLAASPLPVELEIEGSRYAPQSGEILQA